MPFVSVLIPVYNGEAYVKSAIRSVLNQLDGDLEVVIGIDQSSDSSESLVREFSDVRLKIFSHRFRLGMTENYKFLISQARGKWITIIGQDDALLPFATKILRRVDILYPQHELLTSRRSYAFWPDTDKSLSQFSFIYPVDTRKPRLISSQKFLKQAISGYREYSEGPQLYTGSFVRKSLVDRITETNQGDFYNYLIPDVCSAANLLVSTSAFVFSPLPLFVVGSSSKSTGIAVDNVVSQFDGSCLRNSINSFFSSSTTGLETPGRGVFTSFTWYMYEAYIEAIKFRGSKEVNDLQQELSIRALAALKFESKKSKLFGQIQQSNYTQLLKHFEIRTYRIGFHQLLLKLVVLTRRLSKYITAIGLFLSKRLIISIKDKRKPFSLSGYCSSVLSNRHLQKYLTDL